MSAVPADLELISTPKSRVAAPAASAIPNDLELVSTPPAPVASIPNDLELVSAPPAPTGPTTRHRAIAATIRDEDRPLPTPFAPPVPAGPAPWIQPALAEINATPGLPDAAQRAILDRHRARAEAIGVQTPNQAPAEYAAQQDAAAGPLESAATGFTRTFGDFAAGVVRTAGESALTGSAAPMMRDAAEQISQENQLIGRGTGASGLVGRATGSLVPMVPALLSGNPAAANTALGVVGASAYGSSKLETDPRVASGEVSPAQAEATAVGNAAVEVLTERLGLDWMQRYGGQIAKDIAHRATRQAVESGTKAVAGGVVEESAAQVGGNVADMVSMPEKRSLGGAFEGVPEAAASGAVGGLVGTGIAAGSQALPDSRRQPAPVPADLELVSTPPVPGDLELVPPQAPAPDDLVLTSSLPSGVTPPRPAPVPSPASVLEQVPREAPENPVSRGLNSAAAVETPAGAAPADIAGATSPVPPQDGPAQAIAPAIIPDPIPSGDSASRAGAQPPRDVGATFDTGSETIGPRRLAKGLRAFEPQATPQAIEELHAYALRGVGHGLAEPQERRGAVYRTVDADEAKAIHDKTGLSVRGYQHVIDNYGIQHAHREHGDAAAEAARGQEPLTAADFARVPEVVSPENIVSAGASRTDKKAITYQKQFNGSVIVVEEVRDKRGHLAVETVYKKKSGGGPPGEVPQGPSLRGAPPAPQPTIDTPNAEVNSELGPAATEAATASAPQVDAPPAPSNALTRDKLLDAAKKSAMRTEKARYLVPSEGSAAGARIVTSKPKKGSVYTEIRPDGSVVEVGTAPAVPDPLIGTQATPASDAATDTPTVPTETPPVKKKTAPGKFSKAGLERWMTQHYDESGESDARTEQQINLERQEAEAGGNFTFVRDPKTKTGYPPEIERLLESPEGKEVRQKKILQLVNPGELGDTSASGPDMFAEMGEDKFWEAVLFRAGNSGAAKRRRAMEFARKSQDPKARLYAQIHDVMGTSDKRTRKEGLEVATQQTGTQFTFEGHEFEIIEDADGNRILRDGERFDDVPVEAIDEMPVDKGSVTPPGEGELPDGDFAPPESKPQFFDSDAAGVSTAKPGLFGQPTFDKNTGEQGAFFDTSKPTAPERIGSKSANDPKNTGEMFPPKKPSAPGGSTSAETAPDSSFYAIPDSSIEATADVPTTKTITLRPVPMPELLRLSKELLKGKTPFLKRYPGSLGMFYGKPDVIGGPEIGINPKLGQDYRQLAATLAHEAGHLVDFLPNQTLKRGNILGRIATLRDYLKTTLDAVPTDPSLVLTKDDRKKLRQQAQKKVGPRPAKGSADLSAWQNAVSDQYRELLAAEIDSRGLLTREATAEELIALSEWWKPYDPDADPRKTAYRQSSKELYADATSVLLNSPGDLKRVAPTFFKSFMAYMERKPEVLDAYLSVQDVLAGTPETIAELRRADIRESFEKGEDIIRARAAEREETRQSAISYVRQLLFDKSAPITSMEKAKAKGRTLPFSERLAAKHALEELAYADNVNHLMLDRIEREVHKPLVEDGMDRGDAGEYLFLRRVADGDRGGLAEAAKKEIETLTGLPWREAESAFEAMPDHDEDLLARARSGLVNPFGYTPEEARKQLDSLKGTLGAEKYDKLEGAMKMFRSIIFESVEEAVRVGTYNKELFDKIIAPNRDTYATFAVLDHLEDRIKSGVYKQVGTFKDIYNPFEATLMKTITLNRVNELQKAKRTVLDLLTSEYPALLGEEQSIDKHHREKPAKPGRENLKYLVDGKIKYREVDHYIARAFNLHDIGSLSRAARLVSSATYRVFHPLYVTYNLAWQAMNPIRDIKRTYKNLAASRAGAPTWRQAAESFLDLARVPVAYARAAGPAWRRARGKHDATIDAMLADRALGTPFHSLDANDDSEQYDRLLERHGLLELTGRRKLVATLAKALSPVEIAGVFQETLPKVASYKLLGDRGIGGQERAYIVRNYVGTPNTKRRGLVTDLTNPLFMYSNVIIQGYRADAEIAVSPSTAAGYWFRSILTDFGPKALMAAAVAGLMGDELEEWFKLVPEYDLTKYVVIPMGTTTGKDGQTKAVYFRMPHDDASRVLAGVTWLLGSGRGKDAIGKGVGLAFGELPGLSPTLEIPLKWIDYLRGRNPRDDFRGRDIIPRDEWEAGGWHRTQAMMKWTVGQSGALSTAFSWWTKDQTDEGKLTTSEKWVGVTPGLSALVKVSDRGLTEQQWNDIDVEEAERARFKLGLPDNVRSATRERYRLNRFGEDRLSPHERRRQLQLNGWYRRYLKITEQMRAAQERGEKDRVASLRRLLEEQTAQLAERRPSRE